MAPLDIEIDKAYVVRFETGDMHQMGLKIAKCVGRAADGDVLLRTRIGSHLVGGGGWSRQVRRVSSTAVRRQASKREVAINFVVDPVPAAAS